MLTDSYISGSGRDGFAFPQEVQKEYNLTKGGGQFYTDRQVLIDMPFLHVGRTKILKPMMTVVVICMLLRLMAITK